MGGQGVERDKNRRSSANGGDVVRLVGEGWGGGVVLLEDAVGEWKACVSADASVERSTGFALTTCSCPPNPTTLSVPRSRGQFLGEFLPQIRPSARKQPARKSQAALPWSAGGMAN